MGRPRHIPLLRLTRHPSPFLPSIPLCTLLLYHIHHRPRQLPIRPSTPPSHRLDQRSPPPRTRPRILLAPPGQLDLPFLVKLAQHCFVRAIENAPKSAVGWTNLGLLYLHHGDVELANESLIKAQTVDPDYGRAWVGQALVAKHFGDERASRVLFEHAVGLTEGSLGEADYGLGQAVYDALRQPAAMGAGSKLGVTEATLASASFAMSAYIANAPTDVDALHLSALISERLGQMDWLSNESAKPQRC